MRGIYAAVSVLLVPGICHGAGDTLAEGPLSVFLLLAALSALPLVVVMITSFAKLAVVLHILRHGLGTPQVPPTIVITGLALILTAYVMAPTGVKVYQAVEPELSTGAGQGLLTAKGADALYRASLKAREPVRDFLIRHCEGDERKMFFNLAKQMPRKDKLPQVEDRDLLVVAPAFVVSQLSAAFKIGFLLLLPFLVIELVVANILSALGMHMLAPATVALPFKLLLFVMADGWSLLARGLITSYG